MKKLSIKTTYKKLQEKYKNKPKNILINNIVYKIS